MGTVALKVRASRNGLQHAHLRLGLFRDLDAAVRSSTHGVGVGLNINPVYLHSLATHPARSETTPRRVLLQMEAGVENSQQRDDVDFALGEPGVRIGRRMYGTQMITHEKKTPRLVDVSMIDAMSQARLTGCQSGPKLNSPIVGPSWVSRESLP